MKQTVLLLSAVLLLTAGQLANARDGKSNPPLALTIKIKEKRVCAGNSFSVVSRLKNVSVHDVVIDTRFIGRYSTDKAFDQYSSNILQIPKMRGGMGDTFEDEKIPEEYLLKLKPREFFEDIQVINPDKDGFFKLAGRYSIKIGYGQYAAWTFEGVKAFVGSVDSNELNFKIVDCKK